MPTTRRFWRRVKGRNSTSTKFSPLLGIEARKTNRIVRALELLEADTSLTPEELLAIKFDTAYSRNSFAGPWIAKAAWLPI